VADRLIYKSTSAEFLDELFGGDDAESLNAAYQRSLDLLDSIGGAPLSAAAAVLAENGELPPEAVEESETGWRADRIVDRIIRAGYQEAIRLAQDKPEPVPIETFWVTGATDELEVHICEGKRQITVLLLIPLDNEYGSRRADARSWVVRANGLRDSKAVVLLDDEEPRVVIEQVSGRSSTAS
jgi:hypothetical protein